MPNVGVVVRNRRLSRRWSQAHLAQAAGLSKRTVIRIEAGSQVAGESLMAVGAALGMDLTGTVPNSAGRSLLVDLPSTMTPRWLHKIMSPLGLDDTLGLKIVAIYGALCWVMLHADDVGRIAGPTFGTVWFQGWSFVLLAFTWLFGIWLLCEMADDWLSRQDPTRPARITLNRATKS